MYIYPIIFRLRPQCTMPYVRVKKLFKTSIPLLFSGLLNLNDDKSVIESVQSMHLPGNEWWVTTKK